MKKFLSIICVCALLTGFTACAEKNEKTSCNCSDCCGENEKKTEREDKSETKNENVSKEDEIEIVEEETKQEDITEDNNKKSSFEHLKTSDERKLS